MRMLSFKLENCLSFEVQYEICLIFPSKVFPSKVFPSKVFPAKVTETSEVPRTIEVITTKPKIYFDRGRSIKLIRNLKIILVEAH